MNILITSASDISVYRVGTSNISTVTIININTIISSVSAVNALITSAGDISIYRVGASNISAVAVINVGVIINTITASVPVVSINSILITSTTNISINSDTQRYFPVRYF